MKAAEVAQVQLRREQYKALQAEFDDGYNELIQSPCQMGRIEGPDHVLPDTTAGDDSTNADWGWDGVMVTIKQPTLIN